MVERTLQIRKTKSVAAFQSVRIFRRCALIIFYVLNFCSLCPLTHGDTVHTQRIDLRFGLNANQAIQLDYMIQVRDPASTNNAVISEFKNYSEDPFSAGAYHLNNLRNRLLIHGSKTISDYQFLLTIDCSPGAELLVQRKLPTSSTPRLVDNRSNFQITRFNQWRTHPVRGSRRVLQAEVVHSPTHSLSYTV